MKNYKHSFSRLWSGINPFWVYILLLSLCFSCKDLDSGEEEGTYDPNGLLEVTQIVPEVGTITLPLVIHGKNFGTDRTKIKVFFDDVQGVIITVKNNHLYVLTPRQDEGEHTVKVVVNDKEAVLNSKFTYHVTSSVSTVAGTGESGLVDGAALESTFKTPGYIAVDDRGNIIVVDNNNANVRLVSLEDNKVTTLMSKGTQLYGMCFSPDFAHLYLARESSTPLAYDFERDLNWTVSSITSDYINNSATVVVDGEGSLYSIGWGGGIVKRDGKTNAITKVGILPDKYCPYGDDYYSAYNPKDGYIYVSAPKIHCIFRMDASKKEFKEVDFEAFAGIPRTSGLNNGPRLEATFKTPKGIGFDSKGNMYIADSGNNMIRKIDTNGIVTTLTGQTKTGYKDGTLEEALFRTPSDVAIDPEDIIYVADYSNLRIRRIAIQ